MGVLMESDHLKSKSQLISELEKLRTRIKSDSSRPDDNIQFKQMVDELPQMVYEADIKGNITYTNPFALKTFGYKPSDIEDGLNISQIIHPDDINRAMVDIESAMHGSKTITGEYLALRSDGSPLPIITISRGVFKNETPVGIRGAILDATNKWHTEKTLQAREALYRSLFETIGVALMLISNDSIIKKCNSKFEELSGYSREEIEGKMKWSNFVAETDLERMLHYHANRLSGRSDIPHEYDFTFLARGGIKKHVHIVIEIMPETDDRICSLSDITERKLAEEALEKRLIALTRPISDKEPIAIADLFNIEALQDIQDAFASATNVASIITRPDGTPITAPSNFTRFCNDLIRNTPKGCANCYASDAAIGAPNEGGPIVQPCLSGGLWDAGASITVGGHHVANWLIGQVRNEKQSEKTIREYAHEIDIDENQLAAAFHEVPSMTLEQFTKIAQLTYAIASQLSSIAYQNAQQARLISDLQNAEIKLKEAQEVLEKRVEDRTKELAEKASELEQVNRDLRRIDELKSNLVNTVSHELRTPLTSVLGFTKLIKKDLTKNLGGICSSAPDFERSYRRAINNLGIIDIEGQRLIRLINDFLDLSKIESGEMQWNDKKVAPEAIVRQSAVIVDSLFRENDEVQLHISIDPGLKPIMVDEDRIIQVLVNLLSNAYKFTQKGMVGIEAKMDADDLLVAITDTGKGIPPEDINNIFHKFYQRKLKTNESGVTLGTGLGLTISKQIIEHYNGTLSVDSTLGKGSTFFVRLRTT